MYKQIKIWFLPEQSITLKSVIIGFVLSSVFAGSHDFNTAGNKESPALLKIIIINAGAGRIIGNVNKNHTPGLVQTSNVAGQTSHRPVQTNSLPGQTSYRLAQTNHERRRRKPGHSKSNTGVSQTNVALGRSVARQRGPAARHRNPDACLPRGCVCLPG